jgi:hypothetical protein
MTQQEQRDRAKRVIVELVRQSGGTFYNKTNLFKGFWRAHLAYADANLGYLSNWPIVRMPNGPGINDFDHLLAELLADDWIATSEKQFDRGVGIVFTLGSKCPPIELTDRQIQAINEGVGYVQNHSSGFVSDQSHKDSRVWREAKDGEELDIYLDLIPDDERAGYSRGLSALSNAMDL